MKTRWGGGLGEAISATERRGKGLQADPSHERGADRKDKLSPRQLRSAGLRSAVIPQLEMEQDEEEGHTPTISNNADASAFAAMTPFPDTLWRHVAALSQLTSISKWTAA